MYNRFINSCFVCKIFLESIWPEWFNSKPAIMSGTSAYRNGVISKGGVNLKGLTKGCYLLKLMGRWKHSRTQSV